MTVVQWRSLSGQGASSIDSRPPAFATSGRVASHNIGAGRGTRLCLARDLAGTALNRGVRPDIGAFQHG